MKLSLINQHIQTEAKKHFEANHSDEASRDRFWAEYLAQEYGLSSDEASHVATLDHSEDTEAFLRWYYFNHVNPIVIS